MSILSNILCKNINKAMVLKYDHDISLGNITKDYVLISDANDELYVVVYAFEGMFEVTEEKAQTVFEHVRFNKDKFQS